MKIVLLCLFTLISSYCYAQGSFNYVNEDGTPCPKGVFGPSKLDGKIVNCLKEGEWRKYLKDGTLYAIENYSKDTLNGLVSRFTNGGVLYIKKMYKKGALNGVYEKYHTSTKALQMRGYYRDNIKDSVWSEYNIFNGSIRSKKFYNMGKLVTEKEYYAINNRN